MCFCFYLDRDGEYVHIPYFGWNLSSAAIILDGYSVLCPNIEWNVGNSVIVLNGKRTVCSPHFGRNGSSAILALDGKPVSRPSFERNFVSGANNIYWEGYLCAEPFLWIECFKCCLNFSWKPIHI
jgi:hypothetical protein